MSAACRVYIIGFFVMLLLSACSSSDGYSTSDMTDADGAELVVVEVNGSAAIGPLCGSRVEITRLDGRLLFLTQTAAYDSVLDSTEYNATARRLLPYYERSAGRFSAENSFLENNLPAMDELMLVKVTGGDDIDPDGDGYVEEGKSRAFSGPLYAYATLKELQEGNVTVNLLSSAAASITAERHLSVPTTIKARLEDAVEKLFVSDPFGGPVSVATLTRFNPAILEDNVSVHLSHLNDPQLYSLLAQSSYSEGLYSGERALQMLDSDGEGLIDAYEELTGSDCFASDSDNDGVNDYAEVWAGSDANEGSSAYDDTLFGYQWHLVNSGQKSGAANGGTPGEDISVTDVWSRYAGSGEIVVGVLDTGIESGHPDLKNSLDISLSYHYAYHINDPIPLNSSVGFHGTSCAGIIGAQGWNAEGVRGVAPMTRLAGLNIFSTGRFSDIADALLRPGIDIYSNSWGPITSSVLTDWSSLESVVEEGTAYGREGKGNIYVFAAGNDRAEESDGTVIHRGYANTSSLHNSKHVITVSAVDANGKLTSYSSTGANVLIAGTGGEFGLSDPAIVTTDLSGYDVGFDTRYDSDGNLIADSDLEGLNPDGNYTRFMNGTSSACPSVAGVCALMLQANPQLSWRDVKYILSNTARKNDADDSGWKNNGAGLPVNHSYGFGLVDAEAAVEMAKNFAGLPSERVSILYTDNAYAAIPDANTTGIERTINVAENLHVEHVDVWITAADHNNIDDLRITLVSPSGTESVLAIGGEQYLRFTQSYDGWRFSTVHFMDENAEGEWRLEVADLRKYNTGTLQNWQLQISGH